MEFMDVPTPLGTAQVTVDHRDTPAFLLVLTHGSGGDVTAADLLAVRAAGRALGGAVARVMQPYRVAGRRAPGASDRQDEAWLAVLAALRTQYPGVPLVQGGRSNGARVACRTARAAGARAVIALAFPLHPPGKPEKSRVAELRAAVRADDIEVLVISGERDRFGIPSASDATHLHVMPGQGHDLGKDSAAVEELAKRWLLRWIGEHRINSGATRSALPYG